MIGEKLGLSCHMSNLVRIASAGIRQQIVIHLPKLKKIGTDNSRDLFLPIEDALNEFAEI